MKLCNSVLLSLNGHCYKRNHHHCSHYHLRLMNFIIITRETRQSLKPFQDQSNIDKRFQLLIEICNETYSTCIHLRVEQVKKDNFREFLNVLTTPSVDSCWVKVTYSEKSEFTNSFREGLARLVSKYKQSCQWMIHF